MIHSRALNSEIWRLKLTNAHKWKYAMKVAIPPACYATNVAILRDCSYEE